MSDAPDRGGADKSGSDSLYPPNERAGLRLARPDNVGKTYFEGGGFGVGGGRCLMRHPGEGRDLADEAIREGEIPAFAGMTSLLEAAIGRSPSQRADR